MQEQSTVPPEGDQPSNYNAELHVIGSLLIDGDSILRVEPFLKPEHFAAEHHGEIYAACYELFMESIAIDQLTVRDRLNSKGLLEDIGGDAYLGAAVKQTDHAVHIVDYARAVHNAFLMRQVAEAD